MRLSEFDYQLPEELIARTPLRERDAARMLVAPRDGSPIEHSTFSTLPSRLQCGDLLILNDARVTKARLRGQKVASGGVVEVLLDRPVDGGKWLALGSASKGFQPGQLLDLGGAQVRVAGVEGNGQILLEFLDHDPLALIEEKGELPIPPYLERPPTADDDARYQTIYAKTPGAVAAPTAGLHFTPRVLSELEAKGVRVEFLTLLVGPGTFLPIRVEDVTEHQMLEERFVIPEALSRAHAATRAAGGRVIAVGTTVVRSLESAAAAGDGALQAGSQLTKLFIRPGHTFRAFDGLVTNFHLPKSSLLVLISAFAGLPRVREVYAAAVAQRYRFYSYGDCCLFL